MDPRTTILLTFGRDEPLAKFLQAGIDAGDPKALACLDNADLIGDYFSGIADGTLASAHTEAEAVHAASYLHLFGDDPMAEGGQEWPDELTDPANPRLVDIPRATPLRAWRAWSVQGSHLVAPFAVTKWGDDRKTPGVAWRPGVNKNSTAHCHKGQRPKRGRPQPAVHPRLDCRCGIRAVQSLTALRVIIDDSTDLGEVLPPAALAEVLVWGRCAGSARGDDWRFTIRAQFAQITGPVHLAPEYEAQRAALERRYGVSVRVADLWSRRA